MVTSRSAELTRYVINGVVATVAHYVILRFNLEVLSFSSAGLANFVAATIGITVSFFGSRYYVFRKKDGPIFVQAFRFGGLYCSIALFHGLILLIWTDWLEFDYSIGFLLATAFQVCVSYIGNKFLVFSR